MLVVGGITLPFIYKAFHLDDTIFIRLAEEMLRDPLALGLPDHGFGGDFFSLYIDTHPPLIAGYLAVLLKIFGGASEAGLHLGFIFFPALAAACPGRCLQLPWKQSTSIKLDSRGGMSRGKP